jgi:hypothetical protein
MNIIVTALPEYPAEELNEVVKLLNTVAGPVKFIKGETIPTEILDLQIKNYTSLSSLTFNQFWDILKVYRIINKIDSGDYVAIISPKKHSLNWFSGFNSKNIFVDSNDWEYFSEKDSKFGVSFQIVENVIQSLMKLNIESIDDEPNIHFESIGCINDFCSNKKDIMFKLRQSYICNSCIKRIMDEGIDVPTVTHLKNIIDNIRNTMVDNFSLFLKEIPKDPVSVDEAGNLKIGDVNVSLSPQAKSLYYLFLNHDEIVTSNLHEYVDDVFNLYRELKKGLDSSDIKLTRAQNSIKEKEKKSIKIKMEDELRNKTLAMLDYHDGYRRFNKEKSTINTAIRLSVGEKMAEYYIIELLKKEDFNIYRLKIEKDSVSLDERYKIIIES